KGCCSTCSLSAPPGSAAHHRDYLRRAEFQSSLPAWSGSPLSGFDGNGKEKGRAFTRFRFDPYPPAMPLHNFLADCQADTCAFIFIDGMQPLEQQKDAI